MPRKKIDIPDTIEHLSILDETGQLDRELEPDISETLLLKLYRAMVLGRKFDERLLNLQRQGRIGTFAPITGQEASQLGTVAVMRESDWFVPSFRETAAELWRGRSMESVILLFGGYNEGGHVEDGRRNLPVAIPVGSQLLHAVGLGWGIRYRRSDDMVLTFFGDGATSEGDFHEALNFAGVYQTPVIFVCQNNQWAISVPRSKQTRSATIAQKAVAYGIPGIQVDGNDILSVYAATREAEKRARSGDGPTLIECVTYRMMMHTTADDPKRYRSEDDVNIWKQRDPLTRFQNYLIDKGLLTDKRIEDVTADVLRDIQAAVDRAENRMKALGDPMDMFDHAYAALPPHLNAQRDMLAADLAASAREESNG